MVFEKYKMIIEILVLITALFPCIIAFIIALKFYPLIKKMSELNNFLNNDNEVLDVIDTPAEAVEQSNKREKLRKEVINQGKLHHLPGKTSWTCNGIDKTSNKVIDKLYSDYEQNIVKHKAKKTGEAVSKHVVS